MHATNLPSKQKTLLKMVGSRYEQQAQNLYKEHAMPSAYLLHASIEGPAVSHGALSRQPPVDTLCPGDSVALANPGHLQRAKEHDRHGVSAPAQNVLQALRGGSHGHHLGLHSTEGGVREGFIVLQGEMRRGVVAVVCFAEHKPAAVVEGGMRRGAEAVGCCTGCVAENVGLGQSDQEFLRHQGGEGRIHNAAERVQQHTPATEASCRTPSPVLQQSPAADQILQHGAILQRT